MKKSKIQNKNIPNTKMPLGKWISAHPMDTAMFVIAIISLFVVIYYILGKSIYYFHADCTDSLYWANATIESGRVISDTFNYAGILPFSASVWMVPLILIGGMTMAVQQISMVIFAVLFSASLYFMCRSMKWSVGWSSVAVTVSNMLLSGSIKLREIMWEHVIYYSLGLLLFFAAMGVALRFRDSIEASPDKFINKKTVIYGILLFLLCSGIATDDFLIVIISSAPVIVGLFFERFFDGKDKLASRSSMPMFKTIAVMAAGTVFGYIVLQFMKTGISSGYAGAHTVYRGSDTWTDHLHSIFTGLNSLFGVNIKSGDEMASFGSILNIIRMGTLLILVLVPIAAIFFWRKLKDRNTKVILAANAFTVAFELFGWIFGTLSGANWRLTPMLGTSIISCIAVVCELINAGKDKEKGTQRYVPFRVGAAVLALLMLTSFINLCTVISLPEEYGSSTTRGTANKDSVELIEELDKRGLTYGYANFWYSQTITLMSDSKIKVREINVDSAKGIYLDYYQSSTEWYEDQEGVDEYFVILTASQYENYKNLSYWTELENEHLIKDKTFSFKGAYSYTVFVFDINPAAVFPSK